MPLNQVFIAVSDTVVCLKECDSGSVSGSGSKAAAGSHQTFWMTAVTRPRGRAAGQSGQYTFNLMVQLCHSVITALCKTIMTPPWGYKVYDFVYIHVMLPDASIYYISVVYTVL